MQRGDPPALPRLAREFERKVPTALPTLAIEFDAPIIQK
jgi:hypothetical protein